MILCDTVDDSDKLINIVIVDRNLHSLSAKYVRRSYQYRITQSVCNFLRFFCCKYSSTCRSWNLALLKNLIKQLTVFGCIYIFSRCSKDRNAHLHKRFCQLDRCLSTELYNCSVRFFQIYDTFYIFRCQRLEIQLVSDIEVCTYCLRVVIYNNRLVSFFGKCPCTMYRTEVELDTLSDTDRSGTKYQYFLLAGSFNYFILTSEYRVVIWCLCCELSRTGINHLIRSCDAIIMTKVMDLTLCLSCQFCDHIIRKL